MSLQYVLCFRFLTVDSGGKKNPEGLGKEELPQRAEFCVLTKPYEDETFYILSFYLNMSDRTRTDWNSKDVMKILSHLSNC